MSGFKFGGIHISSVSSKIGCRNVSDSLLPEQKEVLIDYNGFDGEIDMSAANILGRTTYKTRTFEREVFIKGGSMQDARQIAKNLASFLSGGYKELVFDENPTVAWTAKVANQISLENVMASSGRANIIFKAQPLGVSGNSTRFRDIPGSTYTATAHFAEIISNSGYYSKPVITINGNLTSCSVTCNKQKTLSCIWPCNTLVFDCEKMDVVADGVSVINKLSGDFFELSPGDNILDFDITYEGNPTVKIRYKVTVL